MTHRQPDIEELLCDYVDGTLNAAQRADVDALLLKDPQLRQSVREMMQVRGVLRELPVEALPAERAQEIGREIRTSGRTSWRMPYGLRLAAALLLTATVALAIWAMLPGIAASRSSASPSERLVALRDEKAAASADKDELASSSADRRLDVVAAQAPRPGAGAVPEMAKAAENAPSPLASAAKKDATAAQPETPAEQPRGAALTAAMGARTDVEAATVTAAKAEKELETKVAAAPAVPAAPAGAPAGPPAGFVPPPPGLAGAMPGPVYAAKGGAGPAALNAPVQQAAVPQQEQQLNEQQFALAPAAQVMVVRASNVPAIQREIDALISGDVGRTIASNASPDFRNNARRGGGFGGAAGAVSANARQKTTENLNRSSWEYYSAGRPGTVMMKAAATAPQAPPGNSVVVRGLSIDQLEALRENVLSLSARGDVRVEDQTILGAAEQRATQQQLRMNQVARQMPSAQARDVQDALQATQAAQADQELPAGLWDLRIIVEPAQLPATAKPANLSSPKPPQR